MTKWYRFYFADGYYCECRGMDKAERSTEERKHGKLLRQVLVATW